MLIDVTADNEFISICSQKLRADKTRFISALDKEVQNNSFLSVCASKGLGVSTFLDMLVAFYGKQYFVEPFLNSDICKDIDVLDKRGSCFGLTFDFAEVNSTTNYNKLITQLVLDTETAAASILGHNSFPRNNFIKLLRYIADAKQCKLFIVLKNFDRVLRFVTKNLETLNAWRRLFALLAQSNLHSPFVYAVVAGTHIPSIIDMMYSPDNRNKSKIFTDLSADSYKNSDDFYGWCGITQNEVHSILKSNGSDLDFNELYDWCGHYDEALFRPGSVFSSLSNNDLFMTINVDSGVWYAREIVNNGYGCYLLCGDIGVGRLFNGEAISMHEININDPRRTTGTVQEVYNFSRRFLQSLYAEGIVSIAKQKDSRLDNAELVNKETIFAVGEAISESDDYLSELCAIANLRNKFEPDFVKEVGTTLGEAIIRYLKAQKKFLGDKGYVSIWQLVYDLLVDLDDYDLVCLRNVFLLKPKTPVGKYVTVSVGVNTEKTVLLNETVNLRLNDLEYNGAVAGHHGQICALVYNLTLDDSPNSEPTLDMQSAYVL